MGASYRSTLGTFKDAVYMKPSEWDNRFPHFKPREYLSPGGMDLFKKNIIPFDIDILDILEVLRTALNLDRQELLRSGNITEVQLIVNHSAQQLRGFVTPEEWVYGRTKEKGQSFSYHLWCAADVSSPQVQPEVLFRYASLLKFRGIILYNWGVHLDLRRGPKWVDVKI